MLTVGKSITQLWRVWWIRKSKGYHNQCCWVFEY